MIRSGAAIPAPYRSGGGLPRKADPEPAKPAKPAKPAAPAAQPPQAAPAGAQGPGLYQVFSSHFENVTLSPEDNGSRNYGTFSR